MRLSIGSIIILLFTTVIQQVGSAQVRPDQFPEETAPNDANFEHYTQKNGVNKKAKPSAFLPMYGAKVETTPIIYVPTPTGNSQNKNSFVTDPNGDVWFIDYAGNAFQFEATASDFTGTTTNPAITIAGVQQDAVATVTGNTNLDGTYNTIYVNASGGNVTLTLPSAATRAGWKYDIIRTDDTGNNVTITDAGAFTAIMYSAGTWATFRARSTGWTVTF